MKSQKTKGKKPQSMSSQQFSFLLGQIKALGLTREEFCAQVGISVSVFNRRIQGQAPFDIDEMYAIMDALGLPDDMLDIVFPPLKAYKVKHSGRMAGVPAGAAFYVTVMTEDGTRLEERVQSKCGKDNNTQPVRFSVVPDHDWNVLKKYLDGREEGVLFIPASAVAAQKPNAGEFKVLSARILPAMRGTLHSH